MLLADRKIHRFWKKRRGLVYIKEAADLELLAFEFTSNGDFMTSFGRRARQCVLNLTQPYVTARSEKVATAQLMRIQSNLPEIICPLSLCIMQDPVTTIAGYTYEKKYIVKWLKNHNVDPVSKITLSDSRMTSGVNKHLVPNHAIRGMILRYAQNPHLLPLMTAPSSIAKDMGHMATWYELEYALPPPEQSDVYDEMMQNGCAVRKYERFSPASRTFFEAAIKDTLKHGAFGPLFEFFEGSVPNYGTQRRTGCTLRLGKLAESSTAYGSTPVANAGKCISDICAHFLKNNMVRRSLPYAERLLVLTAGVVVQLELCEAQVIDSQPGAPEQDVHLDERPVVLPSLRRRLQPVQGILGLSRFHLVVWKGAHHISGVDSIFYGTDLSNPIAELKVKEYMDRNGIKEFKREVVEVNPGEVIFFFSHLPHAGAANRSKQSNSRLFFTLFPIDSGDKDSWHLVKYDNATVDTPPGIQPFLAGARIGGKPRAPEDNARGGRAGEHTVHCKR